jgi:hypothetical protein
MLDKIIKFISFDYISQRIKKKNGIKSLKTYFYSPKKDFSVLQSSAVNIWLIIYILKLYELNGKFKRITN